MDHKTTIWFAHAVVLEPLNAGAQRRAKRVRCSDLFGGVKIHYTICLSIRIGPKCPSIVAKGILPWNV